MDNKTEKNRSNLLVINKPKKILIVTGSYPPATGGKSVYAKLLKDELPKASNDKIRAIIFNTSETKLFYPFRFLVLIIRALNLGRFCDIFYLIDSKEGRPAMLAGRLLRKPVWLRISADDVWPNISSLTAKLAQRADLIIVPGNLLKEMVVRCGIDPEKLVVFSNVFAVPQGMENREAIRKKMKVKGEIVVSVGRLIARKNFNQLLEAWPAVIEKYPEAKLLIIGEGLERKNLEDQITTLDLGDSVLLTGAIDRDSINIYLRLANLFVSTSLFEISSQQIREALMMGTPVLAFPIGDNLELFKHQPNFITVPSGKALADSIIDGLGILPKQPVGEDEGSERMITDFIRLMLKQR